MFARQTQRIRIPGSNCLNFAFQPKPNKGTRVETCNWSLPFWFPWKGTTDSFSTLVLSYSCFVLPPSVSSSQLRHTEVVEAKMTFRRHKYSQCSALLIFCARFNSPPSVKLGWTEKTGNQSGEDPPTATSGRARGDKRATPGQWIWF